MPAQMLAAALDYAKRGTPVFPVSPITKNPLTSHGFKDASIDEGVIRAWWTQSPDAMIGIPTGPRSKMWVLDTDIDPIKGLDGPKVLKELIAKYGPLPETLTSITPRGGEHRYFLWNGVNIRNSESRIGRGIDVRGDGGYAIVPPSMRADGTPYRWSGTVNDPVEAPKWLIDRALKKPRDKAWARRALEDECTAVAMATPGTRNSRLNTAAFNLYQIVAGGGLDEEEVRDRLFKAAEDCGLVADDGERQAWATIDSGGRAGFAQPRYRPQQQSAQPQSAQARPQPQPSPQPQPRPAPRVIRLTEGRLPRAVDEAELALIANPDRHIYQRGDLIVHPIKPKLKAANGRDTFGWRLSPINKHYLVDVLTRIARFEKWDARADDYVPKNCPEQIAKVYLSRCGSWKIPVLLSIVNAPFLRADGSLCERPGYDRAGALLAEFPFVEKIDRSVALSGILTAFDRRAMATAPFHTFTSPVAGTGKSLLVDLTSMLTAGDIAPVISQGKNDEELEKRLSAALIAGDQIISIDNCDREFGGSFLCQALTQQRLKIRMLGLSLIVDVPVTSMFFATGNNLEISNDLTRRTLLCRLDAGQERPELRKFKSNVLEVARTQRGRLVAAILTILRAWHLANTTIGVEPLGSYEEWSFRVRSPLLWLDHDDPCDSIATVREIDPHRAALNTMLVQWKEKLGTTNSYTIQQVIQRAVVDADFFGALAAVAISKQSGSISNDRLGRWLNKNNGKIVNRLKLSKTGSRGCYPLWKVEIV